MNKKVLLTVILAALLAISGGIFAYTYTTGVGVIGIAQPTGDIATVNASGNQPDWSDVLILVPDSETLRPNAAGDECNIINYDGEACPNHYQNVYEVTPDDFDTDVYEKDPVWRRDLYNIEDHITGLGTVVEVTVYARAIAADTPAQASLRIAVKSGTTVSEGADQTITTSWANYSSSWTMNPDTGNPFTWAEIDSLQVGVSLRESSSGKESWVTQVWVEVDYEYLPLTGNVPTGDLFEVYEHPDYSGDLNVRVYLTNVGSLQKAYENLNLELYLEDSEEAGQSPNYRTLTLDTGLASFTLKDPGGNNHTLSVTGGTYVLVSGNISEWEAGWTVTPEFYCEATQR